VVDLRHETRLDVLRQAAMLLDAENRRLHARLRELLERLARQDGQGADELQHELFKLKEQLAQREKALFGASSERRADGAKNANAPKKKDQQVGHGPTKQPRLREVERFFDLDDADKVCPSCGGELKDMGKTEDADEIDVVRREFILAKNRRKKYRCACGNCIETAIGPKKLRPGNRYSIDFAIAVALDKYGQHIPLDRQARLMRREGLNVTTQTLWDQIEALAKLLEGIPERIRKYLLTLSVLGADETEWPLLDKQGGKATKKWYAWGLSSPFAVYYRVTKGRSAEEVAKLVGAYRGTLMTDGLNIYKSAKSKGGCRYVCAFCWAHVRRKFIAAEASHAKEAAAIISLIDELFAIDRACTGPPDSDERIEQLRHARREKAVPVLNALASWAMTLKVLPDTAMGKALRYMTDHWNGLIRFARNPKVPLSNNATERALRGPVVGRKNHYGSRSFRGTQVAATFYTVFESALLAGLDPVAYIRLAVDAVLDGNEPSLPHELRENVAQEAQRAA
jgi:transposase